MRRFACLALFPLLAAASTPAQTPDAAPLVAAERAFAADALTLGIGGSFNKWSTPDAVVIGAGQVQRVREAYPPDVPRPAGEPLLEWWPNFAGVARSGDLGFTTGGVALNGRRTGHYVTIWKRQPDGSWKWICDGGSAASAADVPGPDTEPAILPVAPLGSASPTEAMAEVRAAEQRLAETAVTNQTLAHLGVLGRNARIYHAAWPSAFRFGLAEGGGASDAGDLVWTYGPAAWTGEGRDRRGHYVRLWQKQERAWTLVLAQLIPAPPPPPSPPPPPAGG